MELVAETGQVDITDFMSAITHGNCRRNRMVRRKQLRYGFTLIELLVVIAIIAILAAILFPVFARAKSAAQFATCQSNLKQFAVAYMLYTEDHKGCMPIGYTSYGWPVKYSRWWDKCEKYTRSKQLHVCPLKAQLADGNDLYYGQNCLWAFCRINGQNDPPMKLDSFTSPSKTCLMNEITGWGGVDISSPFNAVYKTLMPGWQNSWPDPRHNGRLAMAFLDGHVRAIRGDDPGLYAGAGGTMVGTYWQPAE